MKNSARTFSVLFFPFISLIFSSSSFAGTQEPANLRQVDLSAVARNQERTHDSTTSQSTISPSPSGFVRGSKISGKSSITIETLPPNLPNPNPNALDRTYLHDIAASPTGSAVAVGRGWFTSIGGALKRGIVYEKLGDSGQWLPIEFPTLGLDPKSYRELNSVALIPNHPDGDFIVAGEFQPDPLSAEPSLGVVARFHHQTGNWTTQVIQFGIDKLIHIRDIAANPANPDQFLIVGITKLNQEVENYSPLLAEYRVSTNSIRFLSIPALDPGYSHEPFAITALKNGSWIVAGTSFKGFIGGKPLLGKISPNLVVQTLANPSNVNGPYSYVYDVAGLSESSWIAVGSYYDATNVNNMFTQAFRFDASTETFTTLMPNNPGIPYPAPFDGTFNQIFKVAVDSQDNVYAVGRISEFDTTVSGFSHEAMAQKLGSLGWQTLPLPKEYIADPYLAETPTHFGAELRSVALGKNGEELLVAGHSRAWYASMVLFSDWALVMSKNLSTKQGKSFP